MSIDKPEDIDPNDLIGEHDYDKRRRVFKPTFELQWIETGAFHFITNTKQKILQQKWSNELGEEEWRDIPLVISE